MLGNKLKLLSSFFFNETQNAIDKSDKSNKYVCFIQSQSLFLILMEEKSLRKGTSDARSFGRSMGSRAC